MTFRDDILEMVDEMIDCDGEVRIGNLLFSRSEIVKRLDPTAYRIMVNEIIDSQIEDLEYEIDHLDPELDADEIADLHERIAELQDVSI
jgi:hypothetical protein